MGSCLAPAAILPRDANKPYESAANNYKGPFYMSTIPEVTVDTQIDTTNSERTNSSNKNRMRHHYSESSTNGNAGGADGQPRVESFLGFKNADRIEQFTPVIVQRLRNSYYAIQGTAKRSLAIEVFKRLLRTMPSAATCFAAAASMSEDSNEGLDLEEDGTSSLRKKGASLLVDLEICLAGLHDSKAFDTAATTIARRQNSWVLHKVLRVVIFSLETEVVSVVKSLGGGPERCTCQEPGAQLNELNECMTCECWKKYFQFMFSIFVTKIKPKRSNQTC